MGFEISRKLLSKVVNNRWKQKTSYISNYIKIFTKNHLISVLNKKINESYTNGLNYFLFSYKVAFVN